MPGPPQGDIALRGHAVQCRITTEDPLDRFIPDYGRITAYRAATGFGIRLDGGTAYTGAVITRHYDSLLEKVTAWASSREGAIDRMRRALQEFRIRGVATNIDFLERLVGDEAFRQGQVTTRFIDDNPELLTFARPRDRASRLLRYIAETTVNGHPEVKDRPAPPAYARNPSPPPLARGEASGGSQGAARHRRARGSRRMDAGTDPRAGHRHHHAGRASVAAGDADAHAPTSAGSRTPTPTTCRSSSRSNAGAAPPSTWRYASWASARGSGLSACARRSPTSCCRCCCAPPTGSATPTTRTTWCGASSAGPQTRASTSSASSIR